MIKGCSCCRVAVMPGTTTLKDVVTALKCGINVDNVGEWIRLGCVVVGALTGGGKTYEINYIWVMDETGILASGLIENGVFSYYERVFISYL